MEVQNLRPYFLKGVANMNKLYTGTRTFNLSHVPPSNGPRGTVKINWWSTTIPKDPPYNPTERKVTVEVSYTHNASTSQPFAIQSLSVDGRNRITNKSYPNVNRGSYKVIDQVETIVPLSKSSASFYVSAQAGSETNMSTGNTSFNLDFTSETLIPSFGSIGLYVGTRSNSAVRSDFELFTHRITLSTKSYNDRRTDGRDFYTIDLPSNNFHLPLEDLEDMNTAIMKALKEGNYKTGNLYQLNGINAGTITTETLIYGEVVGTRSSSLDLYGTTNYGIKTESKYYVEEDFVFEILSPQGGEHDYLHEVLTLSIGSFTKTIEAPFTVHTAGTLFESPVYKVVFSQAEKDAMQIQMTTFQKPMNVSLKVYTKRGTGRELVQDTFWTTQLTAELIDPTPKINGTFGVLALNKTITNSPDNVVIQKHQSVRITLPSRFMTASRGATMSHYIISVDGTEHTKNYTTSSITHTISSISGSGPMSITVTGVDNRSARASVSRSINVIPYVSPVSHVVAERVGGYGNEVRVNAYGLYSTLNYSGANYNQITSPRIQVRQPGGSWTTHTITIQQSGGSFEFNTLTLQLENTEAWEVRAIITDKFETIYANTLLKPGGPILMIETDRKSVGVNKFPVNNEALEVGGDLHVDGRLFVGGQLVSGMPAMRTMSLMSTASVDKEPAMHTQTEPLKEVIALDYTYTTPPEVFVSIVGSGSAQPPQVWIKDITKEKVQLGIEEDVERKDWQLKLLILTTQQNE